MDRGDYLGDPDFNTMPLEQMDDPEYAAAWRKTIDPVKPSPFGDAGAAGGISCRRPEGEARGRMSRRRRRISRWWMRTGNAVSSTYTLNFGFGSGVTVGGLGFLLNDEMDDFPSKMGVPNGFGLIQGPANAIAPGKRPLSCDDADDCCGDGGRQAGKCAGAGVAGRVDDHHDGGERS